jgi:hypothetical protein
MCGMRQLCWGLVLVLVLVLVPVNDDDGRV